MTNNQQKIIDSLIAEFNTRNETKQKSSFNLINIGVIDEINNLHKELVKDSEKSKELWNVQRDQYILSLIDQLRGDLGDRLCVDRGDLCTGNANYSDSIFIYRIGTPLNGIPMDRAFRFEVKILSKEFFNSTTKHSYAEYFNMALFRYVSGNENRRYENEHKLFSCEYTIKRIKELLNF